MSRRRSDRSRQPVLSIVIVALAATLVACGGPAEERPGTLRIRLTDAPVDELTQVNVSIRTLAIKPVEGEAERFAVQDGRVDLLALRDTATLLASKDVRPTRYEYVEVELDGSDANVVDRHGEVHSLQVSRRQIRVSRSAFQVTEGGQTTILLDFDAGESLLSTDAGWILSPIVKIANVQRSSDVGS